MRWAFFRRLRIHRTALKNHKSLACALSFCNCSLIFHVKDRLTVSAFRRQCNRFKNSVSYCADSDPCIIDEFFKLTFFLFGNVSRIRVITVFYIIASRFTSHIEQTIFKITDFRRTK